MTESRRPVRLPASMRNGTCCAAIVENRPLIRIWRQEPENKRKIASRPVSRVLYGRRLAATTWRPFILGDGCPSPHATNPDGRPKQALKVALRAIPIRFCSRWGLPCRPCRQARGGLLPHPFTLTPPANRPDDDRRPIGRRGGLLSVALSLGSPPPDVIRHRVSWSPDFPHARPFGACACGRPADWQRV
jgi:hypothetical protein